MRSAESPRYSALPKRGTFPPPFLVPIRNAGLIGAGHTAPWRIALHQMPKKMKIKKARFAVMERETGLMLVLFHAGFWVVGFPGLKSVVRGMMVSGIMVFHSADTHSADKINVPVTGFPVHRTRTV